MISKIKIGNKIYRVIEDDEIESLNILGNINYVKAEIKIYPKQDEQSIADILAHEAVHGMLDFMGEDDLSKSEGTVNRIANGVLMLIRDNPELFLKFARSE